MLKFKESEFLHDVEIDLNDFNQSVVENAGLWFKYGKLHRDALKIVRNQKLKLEILKRDLEQIHAELSASISSEMTVGGERVTDKAITAKVMIHPRYRQAIKDMTDVRKELVEAEYDESILELADEIFSSRSKMLRALGFFKARELESEVEIRRPRSFDTEGETDKLKSHAKRVIKRNRTRKKGKE